MVNNTFNFLNIEYVFANKIDWNYSYFGKLWTYNLTYFDYLNQSKMNKEDGLVLIEDFINNSVDIQDGFEPFPISLRGMNWIKFLVKYHIDKDKINDSLYAQYMILLDNIEYHLLGNHLLENGFSLLFAAYYFKNETFYEKAIVILSNELNEQILEDGAHFELSPMYHQIMFLRVLDCINLLQNNDWKDNEMLLMFKEKASLMLSWLLNITYQNGEIPLFNDSTNKIAPTSNELYTYARQLGIERKNLSLTSSGYRKMKTTSYECIIDVGNIGPDYIPGHAHSDTFNFEVYIDGEPFIVDTGTSTYETNEKRISERSTKAHNTVMLNNTEQSEVWGGFRVAARAKVQNTEEKKNYISAIHDGYKKKFDAMHQREFFFSENNIKLVDTIHIENEHIAMAYVHFAPGVKVKIKNNIVYCDNKEIYCSVDTIQISEYMYAPEFNKAINASMIEIQFRKKLEMEIKI